MGDFEAYLVRPLIEAEFETDGDELLIRTDHTTYVQIKKDHPLELEEIIGMIQEVKTSAKASGVKIQGEKKARALLKDKYPEYVKNCQWCNQTIDDMAEYARYIEKRGLHVGTTDDRDLNNIICNADTVQRSRDNCLSGRYQVESLIGNLKYLIYRLSVPGYLPYAVNIR